MPGTVRELWRTDDAKSGRMKVSNVSVVYAVHVARRRIGLLTPSASVQLCRHKSAFGNSVRVRRYDDSSDSAHFASFIVLECGRGAHDRPTGEQGG